MSEDGRIKGFRTYVANVKARLGDIEIDVQITGMSDGFEEAIKLVTKVLSELATEGNRNANIGMAKQAGISKYDITLTKGPEAQGPETRPSALIKEADAQLRRYFP